MFRSTRLFLAAGVMAALVISSSAQSTIAFGNLGGVTGPVSAPNAYPIFYFNASNDFWGAVGFTVGGTSYTFDHVTAPF